MFLRNRTAVHAADKPPSSRVRAEVGALLDEWEQQAPAQRHTAHAPNAPRRVLVLCDPAEVRMQAHEVLAEAFPGLHIQASQADPAAWPAAAQPVHLLVLSADVWMHYRVRLADHLAPATTLTTTPLLLLGHATTMADTQAPCVVLPPPWRPTHIQQAAAYLLGRTADPLSSAFSTL